MSNQGVERLGADPLEEPPGILVGGVHEPDTGLVQGGVQDAAPNWATTETGRSPRRKFGHRTRVDASAGRRRRVADSAGCQVHELRQLVVLGNRTASAFRRFSPTQAMPSQLSIRYRTTESWPSSCPEKTSSDVTVGDGVLVRPGGSAKIGLWHELGCRSRSS